MWGSYIALRLWRESVEAFHQALLLAPNGSRSVPLQNVIQVQVCGGSRGVCAAGVVTQLPLQRKTCEWAHYATHVDMLEQAWDEAHARGENVEPPWMSSRCVLQQHPSAGNNKTLNL